MLTAQEQRLLNAARSQMDAEQRAAFDELSDEEKKEMLGEVMKEAKKTSRWQMIRAMSCGEFVRAYGEESPLSATLLWVIIRMSGSKAGCLTLIVIVAVLAFFIWNANVQ